MKYLSELSSNFKGKNILVTGHTGFKGSWLTFLLNLMGAKVFGYSIDVPENSRHSYYELNVESLIVNSGKSKFDVREFSYFESFFDNYHFDYVFHLAAQPLVSESYHRPKDTFDTNVLGVLNLLEILRVQDRQITAIIVTSDKCYKNKEQIEPYSENDELGGIDPYSASKAAAEILINSYINSFFLSSDKVHAASVRAGNVFGGGDWSKNRLIPDCVRDILDRGSVALRMPHAVRPWTFVVDIIMGYLLLATELRGSQQDYSGSWNFSSRGTLSVEEVAQIFITCFNRGQIQKDEKLSIGKESSLLLISPDKSENKLQWRCRFSVEEALNHSAEWYRSQSENMKMNEFSHQFIMKYYW